MATISFPENFLWGTATSAYQIEGGSSEEERGASLWDEYSHTPGKIVDGSNGNIACDHYHRYNEDLTLIRESGSRAYRFSIAWPRVFPGGKGQVNKKGLDFYQRLVDGLLENGITPFVTLNHWDLPLKLYHQGGWTSRDTCAYFADYSGFMAEQLGDRVSFWTTHNEPCISIANCGYIYGVHAPGLKDEQLGYKVKHGLLLAHGQAFRRIKEVNSSLKVGIAEAIFPADPLRPEDARLQELVDSYFIGMVFDPILKGKLPPLLEEDFRAAVNDFRDSDLEMIRTPLDFVGLTNYSRRFYTAPESPPTRPGQPPFTCCGHPPAPGIEYTDMGWEIYPEGIYRSVAIFTQRYGKLPIYITENGAAFQDKLVKGQVQDTPRIEFMQGYLQQLARAISAGYDVRGYFAWSLMDNFEWSYGYTKRFGLIYLDYENLQRIPKASYHWYSKVCREGGFEMEG